ncbi:desmoglein-2.1 [Mugil cephalus]|uniref:desmoglein-2.1 n=1 Tax=Mugil cephalus TaxID=48193 RepID=UPI001FB6F224|nr:desmoglein-2.1 [Mugil cephalus]
MRDISPVMIRASSSVVVLLLVLQVVAGLRADSGEKLVRKRREWVLPPKPLMENVDYTQKEFIARIRSDLDNGNNVVYSLEGRGVNQEPFNVFSVDPRTGNVRVNRVLDREQIDMYNLSGVARYLNGELAEKNIDLRIKVEDQNDNPPVFNLKQLPGQVPELSPRDTLVMQIEATDADEPGNDNSKIFYSIINQSPPDDMFYVNSDGKIYVKRPFLDREKTDQYILTVRAQDLNGRPGGNSATGTVTIKVGDVNDNPPTLEKEEYSGMIEENTYGVEVMRIKAEDLDVVDTDNWQAVFDIVKGNEAGYFSIRTDPNTNEGILMLDKAVDYEDVKNLELGLSVRNKAAFAGGSGGGGGIFSGASAGSGGAFKTYPIKISVKNQPEGPRFDPSIKAIPLSEGSSSTSINSIIARYPAIDGDTGKLAENVRYAKGLDSDNWITVDPVTAEIKLNKIPDRESPALINGTYYAKILCITEDMPAKTATGTVAIQVEDLNDNCPVLTSNMQTMCATDKSIIVSAHDEDVHPHGPPFHFSIVEEGTDGKWQVQHLNDSAALLLTEELIFPGLYTVEFLVKDMQGKACPEPQKVTVQVCTCETEGMCKVKGADAKQIGLGPGGIGLLILGLLLLLLIPLLVLLCQCGNATKFSDLFADIPSETKSHLINYNTEHQGENTEVPLLSVPVCTGMVSNTAMAGGKGFETITQMSAMNGMNWMNMDTTDHVSGCYQDGMWGMNTGLQSELITGFEGTESAAGGGIYRDMALSDHVLERYYNSKLAHAIDNSAVEDHAVNYAYEGHGSPAGSVGCCSLLETDNDLQFLNDLGLKFKTLAEVCGGQTTQIEDKKVLTPLPSHSETTAKMSVSSLQTVQQQSSTPQLQSSISKAEQTVVRETTEHSQIVKGSTASKREAMTTVETGMANHSQMLLLQQQPLYYTTTPVLQPMHYVVQPQVQNTVLLAEAPATNLQGMVLVNDTQSGHSRGVMVQEQTVMSGGQTQGSGMILSNNTGVQRSGVNLIHTGNVSGSQAMMVVDSKVPVGTIKVLKGNQAPIVQGGILQSGMLSGSQSVLVVGEQTSSGGQIIQETQGLSQMREGSTYSKTIVEERKTEIH